MTRNSSTLNIAAGTIECQWSHPDTPRESDTVLTLLHEGLGCVALWRDFPQTLANATGLSVFSYSRFGYGKSDPCDLPRPVSYMHDEALENLGPILDAAGITSTILVGHSDGASIAAVYAAGANDPRVRAATLMAPHFFCEDVSIQSIAEARTAWDAGKLRDKLARYHGDNVDCAFLGWNDTWQHPDFRHWNLIPYLEAMPVPVLAIQGKNDAYGTDDQVNVVKEFCASPSKVYLLENCGHAPHQDQPARTLELIQDFARTVDGAC